VHRLRFHWKCLVTGGKWLYGLLGVLGSVLLVAAIFGVSIGVALTRGPKWLIWAVPLAAVMFAFVEGSFRVHRADRAATTGSEDHMQVSLTREGVTAVASVPRGRALHMTMDSEGVKAVPFDPSNPRIETESRANQGGPPTAEPDD
jgi:hypothetical protein